MATGRYHWSNCAPPARFFKIHYSASVPWLLLLLRPGWWQLIVAVVVTLAFIYIEVFKKMSLIAFVRLVMIGITGRVKSTVNIVKELTK